MSEAIINPDANMCDTLAKAVADLFRQLRSDGVITGAPKTQQEAAETVESWVSRLKSKAIDAKAVRDFAEHVSQFPPQKWPPCQAFFDWKSTGTTSGGTAKAIPYAECYPISREFDGTELECGHGWRVGLLPATSADVWVSEPASRRRMIFKGEDGMASEQQLKEFLRHIGHPKVIFPGHHLGLMLGTVEFRACEPAQKLKHCNCGHAAQKVVCSHMRLEMVMCTSCDRSTGWVRPGGPKTAEDVWR